MNVKVSIKKKQELYILPAAFDIEVTTIPYKKNKKGDFIIEDEYYDDSIKDYYDSPLAFMYHWQFAIMYGNNQLCIMGREWDQFLELMEELQTRYNLDTNRRIVIYVHNLSYEFQFIQCFFTWTSVFARSERKVMKVIAAEGFEFRCSYFLSNMSLEKFCKNTEGVIHGKVVDVPYNYKLFRTPRSRLTPKEKKYCQNDVLGLVECINSYYRSDTPHSIPLTSTGFVRREARNRCLLNPSHRSLIRKSFPTEDLYRLCRDAFRGGDTHANRIFAGRVMNNVYSYDLKSSYPAWMMYEEYPMGQAQEVMIDSNEDFCYYLDNYLMVLQIELYDIEVKSNCSMPYIDIAHCKERSHIEEDNGRVLAATYILYDLTSIDWRIIEQEYDIKGGYKVRKAYIWNKGHLPKELRETVLEYFDKKTTLDGIDEMYYEYLKSKNKLNALFGMMVTALDMNKVVYEDLSWGIKKVDLNTALTRVYNSSNTFLLYQWGIFITAYARLHLHEVLQKVGMDAVYIDTDSIKFINKDNIKYFEVFNENIMKKAETSEVRTWSDTPQGERMILGVWESEGCYKEFKTLGAKKYCMTNKKKKKAEDPDYIITVSGMNKDKGSKAIKSMNDFALGKVFENVGRTTAFYNDCYPFWANIKGEKILITPNIAILDTTYTLGVTDTYYDLILNNLVEEERIGKKKERRKKEKELAKTKYKCYNKEEVR